MAGGGGWGGEGEVEMAEAPKRMGSSDAGTLAVAPTSGEFFSLN